MNKMQRVKGYYKATEFKEPWERRKVAKARELDKALDNASRISDELRSRQANIGDRVRFTKSYLEGKTGTLKSIRFIAGIPWYEVAFDDGTVRGGQYEGFFEKV